MITLVKAPSVLGLRPTGVEQLPRALRDAGLMKRLDIEHTTTVLPPPYNNYRDPATRMLNAQSIAKYSTELANVVQATLESGNFPLVLGGDCSIILGNMLALRRKGRYGLLFLDGHADFYQPEASTTGEAADMDLALVSGHGPDIVTNLEGLKPLVQEDDIVQFGQRDRKETIADGSQQIADTNIHVFELATIRKEGLKKSSEAALVTLKQQSTEGFWVHIDADVINDDEMPAVDYRLPGGLTFEEMYTVLSQVMATGRVTGLSLAIYNPLLDPHKQMATKLVALLSDTLQGVKNT
jgi:arginase